MREDISQIRKPAIQITQRVACMGEKTELRLDNANIFQSTTQHLHLYEKKKKNKYIYVMKIYRTWYKMKNVMPFKTPLEHS